jgi:hypothetical protein
MNVEDRIEASRHLRGQIAACEARMRELHAELSSHDAAIKADMQQVLATSYGKDYAPRITFYTSERAAAVPYVIAEMKLKDPS